MLYIARQPILDLHQSVVGYELLFRPSAENTFGASDPDKASKQTVDTALLVGLDTLSDGKEIYLNCTSELILGGYASLIPPGMAVIEVLETVEPTPELVEACRELKNKGYRIALDDFVDHPSFEPLVELADVIKVDFRLSCPAEREKMLKKYGANRTMLAEKVETHEEFEQARQLGFHLFQGYFFCKPRMMSARNVPWSGETGVSVLRALSKVELDFVELERIVKAEPALCYRLLRYLNSPAFYLETEVHSIMHALMLLGNDKVRRWLLLVAAIMHCGRRNPALVHMALLRARFGELLAPYTRTEAGEMFMLSLFSLLDAMLQVPLEVLLRQVPIPKEVAAALLGRPNRLRRCFELVLAYERGDWGSCEALGRQAGSQDADLRKLYVEAVCWAGNISRDAFSSTNP
jgi:c-di-GMP-related signal transduction protein